MGNVNRASRNNIKLTRNDGCFNILKLYVHSKGQLKSHGNLTVLKENKFILLCETIDK